MSYIVKQGGRHTRLADTIVAFLRWAQEERHIFFLATYISSGDNWIADTESRRRAAVPMLNPTVFRDVVSTAFGPMDVDAMATGTNAQLPRYISWKPDPAALAIDVFRQDLTRFNRPFFNPPALLIPKVLRLIEEQQLETVVLVVPLRSLRSLAVGDDFDKNLE